jgi:DNA replication protein DnaC
MKSLQKTISLLSGLKLKGISENLDEEIISAERNKISYINFLTNLLQQETNYRTDKKLKRNFSAAHFPILKKLKDFEFGKVQGISKTEIANILEFQWLDNHENILFFGPPGLGKTHLSIAIGIEAIKKGYSVCFERITSLIKILKTAEIQKSAEYRIKRVKKADLLIIDEIGYTPIERREANLLFNLVSEMYEKSSIIITSNKNVSDWAEMLGDEVMTIALLDRLLHHSKIFNLDGKSYRLQKKEKEV